jgi:shikimate dehydrogenase
VKRYGLIGYPLGHSFSKKYFTEKFSREGINDSVYENFPIADIADLTNLIEAYPDLNGLNVTIPYKEKIIPFLTYSDEIVKETGACNCIRVINGKLYGYNTDVTGFKTSLETKLEPNHSNALILGKGGAAKAVAYVLKTLGIDFMYVVRRADNDVNTILYHDLDQQMIGSHPLIINTTPLGTYPDIEECPPILYEALTSKHYLFDLVYNPSKTLFLMNGELSGATIRNGADMLTIQAEESWRIWNAGPPPAPGSEQL